MKCKAALLWQQPGRHAGRNIRGVIEFAST
jgi:hypothetical protein